MTGMRVRMNDIIFFRRDEDVDVDVNDCTSKAIEKRRIYSPETVAGLFRSICSGRSTGLGALVLFSWFGGQMMAFLDLWYQDCPIMDVLLGGCVLGIALYIAGTEKM